MLDRWSVGFAEALGKARYERLHRSGDVAVVPPGEVALDAERIKE
jgi:hypothetical protein